MRSASSQMLTPTANRAPRSGLTLFEVLLSLAILAAAMAAIAQLVSSGVQASVRAATIRGDYSLPKPIGGADRRWGSAVGGCRSAICRRPRMDLEHQRR